MYAKSIMNMNMIVAYRSLQIRHTVYSLRVCHKSGPHQCMCLCGSQTMCARVSIKCARAIIYQYIYCISSCCVIMSTFWIYLCMNFMVEHDLWICVVRALDSTLSSPDGGLAASVAWCLVNNNVI